MAGWPVKPLGDLVDIISGATPPTSRREFWSGPIPFLTIADLATGRKMVRSTARSLTAAGLASVRGRTVPPGTVVISARGTVGLTGVAAAAMALNQSCYGLLARPEALDQDFLYYFLKLSTNELSFLSHGCIFDTITRDTLKSLQAPLPPLAEQRRQVALLKSLDDQIDLLWRQSATLESLAETIFKGRLMRGPTRPARLGDLAKIGCGRPLPKNRLSADGACQVLGAGGPVGRADEYLFEGDLLVTGRVGTLGRVFMARRPERTWPTDNTLVLTEAKHIHLLYFLLREANLKSVGLGSSQPLLRRSDLASFETRLPAPAEIARFELFCEPVFAKAALNARQLRSLADLRDALIPRLMPSRR